ncbi:MAG: hypothetical protein MUE49_10350 [Rhodospirillales bacterium]|jgi:hypothetical protein|nr:hypothetical protein [Rhodospirillales bacterium]
MKKAVLTAIGAGALCGVLAIVAPAEAKINFTGSQSYSVTAGNTTPFNQLVNGLYGTPMGNTVSGWVFGKESTGNQFFPGGLEIVGGAHQLTMSYLGSEAGHKNQFFFNNTLLKTTPGNSNQVFPAGQAIGVNPYSVSNGLLDFFFKANGGNGGTGLAPNGGAAAAFCTDCSIFVVFLDKFGKPTNPTAKDGFIVDIFFDDGGTNDNHDDMGIRISATPVPVPAALPILAAALAGFGFAGYRSRRDA